MSKFSCPSSFPLKIEQKYIASRRISVHCSKKKHSAVCSVLYVTVTCIAARWSASVSAHKYLPAPSQQAFIIVNTLYVRVCVMKECLLFLGRCCHIVKKSC